MTEQRPHPYLEPYEPPPYPYDLLDELRAVAAERFGAAIDCSIGAPVDPPPASGTTWLGGWDETAGRSIRAASREMRLSPPVERGGFSWEEGTPARPDGGHPGGWGQGCARCPSEEKVGLEITPAFGRHVEGEGDEEGGCMVSSEG